jgi:MoaA/NifB/PqqE/SkfB family radical SAM enzyme
VAVTYIAPQAKLFGHLDRLSQIVQDAHTVAPVNVEIDLSNRCSLGCEWCHFAYTHTRGPLAGKRAKPDGATVGGDLMNWGLALEIIDQLISAGVRSVTWTGGGEPTLHPQFDEIVAYADTRIRQGLYTHGGHIDEQRAWLLKAACEFVYVSLDAADPESYKRDKGVDRFEAACEGVRRLADAPGEATVGVGFLLGEHNWFQARKMVELGKSLGADYVQFRPMVRFTNESPDEPAEDTAWLREPLRELFDGLASDPQVEIDVDRFRMYKDWRGHGYQTCWWSMLQTAVTPNGKVWACVNKREHPAAEIGDLSCESFSEVWARHTVEQVGSDCRVMCRGHLPNLALDGIVRPLEHAAFI